MESLKLDRISDCAFTVEMFSVTNKTVFPPDAFICRSGAVLRERFFYVVKGKIIFNDNTDDRCEFSAGEIVYLPYNVTYRSRWDEAENGKFLSVNFILCDKNGNRISFSDRISLLMRDKNSEFLPLFTEIALKWSEGKFGYRLETRALFYEILHRLTVNARMLSEKNSRSDIGRAILFLENNYLSDVTVERLADMANVGECMFRRTFKAEKGMSPVRYRNLLRLKKAREMLESGEFSVLETAMAVGFDDTGYFSKLFKREFGMNPSECAGDKNTGTAEELPMIKETERSNI